MTTETTGARSDRRWPWIVGIVAAFGVGIPLGAAMQDEGDTHTITETVEVESEELLSHVEELEAELETLKAAEEVEPVVPVDDEAPADAADIAIGDTVTVTEDGRDAYDLTVSDVEALTTPQRSHGDLPRHGVFVVFTVEVTGLASTTVAGSDFYVLDEDGVRYDEGDGNSWDAVGDLDDLLSYVSINAGERRSGKLVFDIPEGSGQLAYAPNYRTGPIGVWEFNASP